MIPILGAVPSGTQRRRCLRPVPGLGSLSLARRNLRADGTVFGFSGSAREVPSRGVKHGIKPTVQEVKEQHLPIGQMGSSRTCQETAKIRLRPGRLRGKHAPVPRRTRTRKAFDKCTEGNEFLCIGGLFINHSEGGPVLFGKVRFHSPPEPQGTRSVCKVCKDTAWCLRG